MYILSILLEINYNKGDLKNPISVIWKGAIVS